MSGDLLVLAGQSETLALYLPTEDPRGEVVWQEKEEGDLYAAPYFHGDRLVSVRKMPFNLTVRYRSTGQLMGRLALPDLSLFDEHPLLENGPRELPVAHDGRLAGRDRRLVLHRRGRREDDGGVEAADRRERRHAAARRSASRSTATTWPWSSRTTT